MISFTVTAQTPQRMYELGSALGALLRPGDLVLLTGELGAGKTTLTRGIAAGAGIKSGVSSPTFVIARTHKNTLSGVPFVHIDAYRLSDSAEFEDLDIDFESSTVVAEWGAGLVPAEQVSLEIVIERPRGGSLSPDFAAPDLEDPEPRLLRFSLQPGRLSADQLRGLQELADRPAEKAN